LTADLAELSRRLGHRFSDATLLRRALTHRSRGSSNYERLEFLGDSLLNFVIAAELFERFPTLSEGDLTRMRARLVNQDALAGLARGLELGQFLELGGGEYKSGGFERDSILADALEAVLGAIYRDGGLDSAWAAIGLLYRALLDQIDPQSELKDPKTRLQEYTQKRLMVVPVYTTLEVTGEAHQQHFIVQCEVPGVPVARGEGASRRAAEQEAAELVLRGLKETGHD